MKALLAMPNVSRVRAGLRHVDLDMAIMFDPKKEVDAIKNHLRDKGVNRLQTGPPNNPDTNIHRAASRSCYNAYTNAFWYFSDDQSDKLPNEAVIDTQSGLDPDSKVMKFSLALKATGAVIINGAFDNDSTEVKVNVLESINVKGLKIQGKDVADEI